MFMFTRLPSFEVSINHCCKSNVAIAPNDTTVLIQVPRINNKRGISSTN